MRGACPRGTDHEEIDDEHHTTARHDPHSAEAAARTLVPMAAPEHLALGPPRRGAPGPVPGLVLRATAMNTALDTFVSWLPVVVLSMSGVGGCAVLLGLLREATRDQIDVAVANLLRP